MSIPVVCESCGHVGRSRMFGIAGTVTNLTLKNNWETCGRCRKMARIVDGTYSFANGVMTAFQEPGVTREKMERFRAIAQDVRSGAMPSEQAAAEAKALGAPFGRAWALTRGQETMLNVIMFLITLWISINSSNESSEISREILAESQRQTAVQQQISEGSQRQTATDEQIAEQLRKLTEIQQKILSEVQKRPSDDLP